jgi:hypothetical protein
MCESGGVPATRQNEHGREYGQWFHDYGSVGIERCHASPIRARVYWLAQQGVIPTQENLVIENVEMYEIKPSS